MSSHPELVDAYLDGLPAPQQAALEQLRVSLRSILPTADEGIRYGMPCFSIDDKGVAGFAAAKEHLAFYPMSGGVIATAGEAVAEYATTKGGLTFAVGQRLPVKLLRLLMRLRLDELSTVTNGPRTEYFDDGRVKAAGRMKAGELHGAWEWFRKDGTLMRTGQFSQGQQTGTWTTWDRNGEIAKVTNF